MTIGTENALQSMGRARERRRKNVSALFDPEQHSNDCQFKKKRMCGHCGGWKAIVNNGGAAGEGPVRRHVQPLRHTMIRPISPDKNATNPLTCPS